MILEYLNHDSIRIFNNSKNIEEVLKEGTALFPSELVQKEIAKGLKDFPNIPYSSMEDSILIPHFRISGITKPEVRFLVIPNGVALGFKKINIILILVTPENQPALHLRILQGLSSLLPQIESDVIQCKQISDVLTQIQKAEADMKPSFKNMNQNQIAFELQTNLEKGLTQVEAKLRLTVIGKNQIEREKPTPLYWKAIKSFFSLFAVLLWIATALCFIPGVDMPELGLAILIVILMNGIFSFLQEAKSDNAVDALRKLLAQESLVMRDGIQTSIPADELVPGDCIFLQEGDIVPADCRIIEADDVEVDNSSLTGESTSARRYKAEGEVLLEGKFLWLELPNILFAGSSILKGTAKAVVFGTGMYTEIGQIASITSVIKREESPLQKQLKSTVFTISVLAFSIGLVFLFLGWMVAGLSFVQAFIFFIGIFVANVPEGLLPTVTLSLALGVSRMAKRNAILKDLSSVETLGCTSVICSDKTGTLTQNSMRVVEVSYDQKTIPIVDLNTDNPTILELLLCGLNCNNAGLSPHPTGDPTELALLYFAEENKIQEKFKRIYTNAFESVRKRMSVVVEKDDGTKVIYAKGGSQEILAICTTALIEGKVIPIDDTLRKKLIDQSNESASKGYRLLSFAYSILQNKNSNPDSLSEDSNPGFHLNSNQDLWTCESLEKDLTYLGFTCMADPIRPKVPQAIHDCHTAGIRILMITGDHPLTAGSVAKSIGIGGDHPVVITGTQVDEMKDPALKEWIRKGEPIFARVSPSQKLRIVTALKELGEIVAVTGDGVNDGPALKKADMGIAMGKRGTEVAKEAARMILADDDFSTIVAAIEEGRAVFDNIRKFSGYVLNSNPQELIPFLIWVLIPGYPLLMTVMGVLAVDVGTDLIPAMGLGAEPPEKGIMERPPRNPKEKLISIGFILRSYLVQGSILCLSCFLTYYYFIYTVAGGVIPSSPEGLNMSQATPLYLQSLTAFFFPTITVQIANVMCKRSAKETIFQKNFFDNRIIFIGIGFAFFLCLIFFYTDLKKIYYFEPVPWHVYLFAFHGTFLLLGFEETKKFFRRRGYPLTFLA
jgi:sodium/potassium-transporting ATPase subunit alpha